MAEILLLLAIAIAAVVGGLIALAKIQHHHEIKRLGHELNNLPIPKHILFSEEVEVYIGDRTVLITGTNNKGGGEDKHGNIVHEIFDPRKPERFSHVPCGYVKKSKTINTGETVFEIHIIV